MSLTVTQLIVIPDHFYYNVSLTFHTTWVSHFMWIAHFTQLTIPLTTLITTWVSYHCLTRPFLLQYEWQPSCSLPFSEFLVTWLNSYLFIHDLVVFSLLTAFCLLLLNVNVKRLCALIVTMMCIIWGTILLHDRYEKCAQMTTQWSLSRSWSSIVLLMFSKW